MVKLGKCRIGYWNVGHGQISEKLGLSDRLFSHPFGKIGCQRILQRNSVFLEQFLPFYQEFVTLFTGWGCGIFKG
jgi:hypothetical protein